MSLQELFQRYSLQKQFNIPVIPIMNTPNIVL